MAELNVLLLSGLRGRLAENKRYVAHAIEVYKRARSLGDDELRARLGCSMLNLVRLSLCLCPERGGDRFDEGVSEIAEFAGVDRGVLAEVLSE